MDSLTGMLQPGAVLSGLSCCAVLSGEGSRHVVEIQLKAVVSFLSCVIKTFDIRGDIYLCTVKQNLWAEGTKAESKKGSR